MPNTYKNIHLDQKSPLNKNIKVAILGGGIGGCMAALRLAEKFSDIDIKIFEKNNDLLLGTSNCTPGRMGLGFHYVYPHTGITYLRQTIDFVKNYYESCPDLMIGQEFPKDNYLRNGRYFIVKDSLFSATQILTTYKALAKEYTELVNIDKENAQFGDPGSFYRILQPDEYKNDVNIERIDIAIETREHLLNWPSFRKFLLSNIDKHENIEVLIGKEVYDISYLYTQSSYVIHLKQEAFAVTSSYYQADFVVNATWEWIDYFNSKIGYYRLPNEIRTNRAKTIIKVKLPDELIDKPSMFFCMGPHCMFSNIGNGYGLITYAFETNLLNSISLLPEKDYVDLINRRISFENQSKIATNIISGVSQYIPAMRKAEVVEVRFGTVQVEGEANIFDPLSKIHQRHDMGLRYLENGFISLSCMKLLYGHGNSNSVAQLFGEFKEKILPLVTQIRNYTSILIYSDEKIEKKDQNLKISLLSGLCFAWYKKSHPEQNNICVTVPIESFCTDFFKKLAVNREFNKTNKNVCFSKPTS